MRFRAGKLNFDLTNRVLLMGILNVTPDSFSDGGDCYSPDAAIATGLQMFADGADIIDIGGESTRPGADSVSAEEELDRVIPVIRGLRRQTDMPISIDTWKAEVAADSIEAGAQIINDISGFRRDPEMLNVAARSHAGCIAMHMRGTPQTMQQFTEYRDLLEEVNDYFANTLKIMAEAGIQRDYISLDPGIGFSKTVEQNLELVRRLDELKVHGCPVFLGPSRKSFIGKTLGIDVPKKRIWGTAAAVAYGIAQGARIVRVHDVCEMKEVCDLAAAIKWPEEKH